MSRWLERCLTAEPNKIVMVEDDDDEERGAWALE